MFSLFLQACPQELHLKTNKQKKKVDFSFKYFDLNTSILPLSF